MSTSDPAVPSLASTAPGSGPTAAPMALSPLDRLAHEIEHAAHLLPAQGPITVFIHHNTLHAFEDLPFCEGVVKGGEAFGCQPFLAEERYREELERGRIRHSELRQVLLDDLGAGGAEDVAGL